MPKLESAIERDVGLYALDHDCMVLKLNVWGRVGWPDRLFLYHGARILFIEFKRPGEKPKKIQEYIHSRLRKYGFWVEVVEDIPTGKRLIDQLMGEWYVNRMGTKAVPVRSSEVDVRARELRSASGPRDGEDQ